VPEESNDRIRITETLKNGSQKGRQPEHKTVRDVLMNEPRSNRAKQKISLLRCCSVVHFLPVHKKRSADELKCLDCAPFPFVFREDEQSGITETPLSFVISSAVPEDTGHR
jgi:hypothetical protein